MPSPAPSKLQCSALLALCCALFACGDDDHGGSGGAGDAGPDAVDAGDLGPDSEDAPSPLDAADLGTTPDLTIDPDPVAADLLDRLAADSLEPPCVRLRDGIIRTLDVRIPASALGGAADPAVLARVFSDRYARDLGLESSEELDFLPAQREDDLRIARARRLVSGVPVFGAEARFVFQLEGDELVLSNVFAALPAAPALPSAEPTVAERTARDAAEAASGLAEPVTLRAELSYFDAPLLGHHSPADGARPPGLAWRVLVEGDSPPFAADVFVAADDGAILRVLPATSASRFTYTADEDALPAVLTGGPAREGLPNLGTGFLWFLDGARISRMPGEPEHDDEGAAVDREMASALAWLELTFGAPSWDRSRADLHTYAHFSLPGSDLAFWHPYLRALFVSQGYLSPDVALHELGHAVNLAGADFVRWGEAAALDESFADLLAFLRSGDPVLRHGGCASETDASCVLRDLDGGELADHARSGPRAFDIGASPHYNSGIPTHAALDLLATSDERAAALAWWRGYVAYLTPSTAFLDARWQLHRACTDLAREAGGRRAQARTCAAILAAFADVGVGGAGTAPEGARICAPSSAN